jgi:hypothetical protein
MKKWSSWGVMRKTLELLVNRNCPQINQQGKSYEKS